MIDAAVVRANLAAVRAEIDGAAATAGLYWGSPFVTSVLPALISTSPCSIMLDMSIMGA